jgi:hypothetical protein
MNNQFNGHPPGIPPVPHPGIPPVHHPGYCLATNGMTMVPHPGIPPVHHPGYGANGMMMPPTNGMMMPPTNGMMIPPHHGIHFHHSAMMMMPPHHGVHYHPSGYGAMIGPPRPPPTTLMIAPPPSNIQPKSTCDNDQVASPIRDQFEEFDCRMTQGLNELIEIMDTPLPPSSPPLSSSSSVAPSPPPPPTPLLCGPCSTVESIVESTTQATSSISLDVSFPLTREELERAARMRVQEDPSDGSIEKCPYDFDFRRHKYVKKNLLKKSVVYYCFYYRNGKLGYCKNAELRIPRDRSTGEVLYNDLVVTGKHNFACCQRNGVDTDEYDYLEKNTELANELEKENLTPKKARLANIPKKVDETMRIRTRELATDPAYRTTAPVDLWAILKKEMDDKYECWTGLHRDQVLNLIKNTRTELNQGNAIAAITDTPDYYLMTDSKSAFVRYQASMPNPENETKPMMRMMVFGNPELLRLLKGRNLDLYMDATFDCCPDPFYQCLIIMIYEPTCSYYVPVMYILMTHKNETLYWHAFNQVVIQSQWTLNVKPTRQISSAH